MAASDATDLSAAPAPATNGTPPPAPAPAPEEPPVRIPSNLATVLLRVALRTELGQAYWGGFVTGQAEAHPWLLGDPNALRFTVPDSEVKPIPEAELEAMRRQAQQAQGRQG